MEINIVGLSIALAENRLKNILPEEKIYVNIEEESFYTEEAQNLFNELYDEYFETILNHKKKLK